MTDIFKTNHLVEKLSNIIANDLDEFDGQKDKQIEKSIWDEYADDICTIKTSDSYRYGNAINFADAVSHIKTHLSGLATEAFNEFCKKFGIDEIDENGNIIENVSEFSSHKTYDNNGELLMVTNYKNGKMIYVDEYDGNGNIEKSTNYNDNEKIGYVDEYKDGERIKSTSYNESGKINYVNEYKDGKRIKTTSYYENGKISGYWEVDKNGNIKKATYYYQNGEISEIYEYDNGKRISGTVYDVTGKVSKTIQYDKNEKPKQKTCFNSDGIKSSEEHYDAKGNISKTYYADNDRISKTEVFDPKTQLWTVTEYNNAGEIIKKTTVPMILDGAVGESAQEGQGDCYLMASINAIRNASGGKEYLNSMIKENNDGTYTVTLPGAKIAANNLLAEGIPKDKMYITGKYTFTLNEMKTLKSQEGKRYSIGDDDVILIEAAFEKYRKEVEKTMQENNIEDDCWVAGKQTGHDTNNILASGRADDAIFILTGEQSECYASDDKPMTNYKEFSYQDGKNAPNRGYYIPGFRSAYAPTYRPSNTTADKINTNKSNAYEDKTFSIDKEYLMELLDKIRTDQNSTYIATCSFYNSEGDGHAFTIKSVTGWSVILINPWYPDKTIEMSIDDFTNTVGDITLAKMPQVEIPYNI